MRKRKEPGCRPDAGFLICRRAKAYLKTGYEKLFSFLFAFLKVRRHGLKRNQQTNMKTLQILSRHSSLTAAVKASGIDLSYNEPLAMADLAGLDKGNPYGQIPMRPVNEAFVVIEDGKTAVFYVLNADISLLNKYTPFHGCLHDGKFSFAIVDGQEIRITDGITSDRSAIRSALEAVKGADSRDKPAPCPIIHGSKQNKQGLPLYSKPYFTRYESKTNVSLRNQTSRRGGSR